MEIAVFSDSHDNIWRLDEALGRSREAGALIHCGDLCSPFMIQRLGERAEGRPVHLVWGNNEGDVRLICRLAASFPNLVLHGDFAELELDGLKIAVNHYPAIARPLAASGRYDLVCYGHDHTACSEMVGECRLLNPGELMGLYGSSTFALFETRHRTVQFVRLGETVIRARQPCPGNEE